MTIIHSVDAIKIKKINDREYSITNDPFFSSFFSLYNIQHKRENEFIIFNCQSIKTLKEFIKNSTVERLSYDAMIKFIYDIGFTIKTLEQQQKAILCFGLDDIMVINENIYFFINSGKILPIIKKQITLKMPLDIKKSFLTPDVNWKQLPIKAHFNTGIYSFALLLIYTSTKTLYEKGINDDILNPIFQTKLYYFILRCLNDNPDERMFLYI
ncbi:MAG: hypothetical protein WD512_15885 [Candidatus Paceibacterota bacterium]